MTEVTEKADASAIDPSTAEVEALLATADPVPVVSIFDFYDTDINEEEEGRWFENIIPGASFKLRRFTAKAVNNERNRLQLAFRKYANKDGSFPENISTRIVNEQMGVIIADWRGDALVDRDGSPLVYSPEKAKALAAQLPNLRTQLLLISMDMASYRTTDRKEIEGN